MPLVVSLPVPAWVKLCVSMSTKSLQSYPNFLCDLCNVYPPGSSDHGILGKNAHSNANASPLRGSLHLGSTLNLLYLLLCQAGPLHLLKPVGSAFSKH